MRKNEVLTLSCERLGAELEGVCRSDGMAVFVPGMLPGETAEVRIVKAQTRYAFGRLEKPVGPPSPDRVAPDCPAYPRCGGCSGRHMRYEATLEAKRQQVADCFRRIAHIDADVPPVIGMEHPSAYRNKTSLPVGGTAEAPVVGFYAPRSHHIVPVGACPNAMPPASAIADALLAWMRLHRIEPWQEETGTGLIRHLVVRVNRRGEALACVVAGTRRLPHERELARALTDAGAVGVVLNTNPAQTNVILGPEYRTLAGAGELTDRLCGLEFRISPAAFFQVNPEQTEVLYGTAIRFAGLKPGDLVCDVYCGAGTISLAMAAHCHRVIGIEIVPQAVDNARANAAANGITNAEFLCGAAEDLLPKLVSDGLRPDVLVVDPPRKGLEEAVIRAMDAAAPSRIVYVSCNPDTLARDAGLLRDLGWQVDEVQPVDMFCWTSGVETVCLLSKVRSAPHIDIGS
ncbi:MAG: 23S rRNA (uracil(1939)-C(5))-methyltransferase RlmD [Clostridia bacterium]|nr:23S rRNA (uracil(1939)-C(5))-methyltransferase RlmD [Clostridia bacterium]